MASKRKRRATVKKRKASLKRSSKRKTKGVQIGSKQVFNVYG